MSWSDKIQQLDQQVAGSVRDALTKAKEELDELLRSSQDELSQRLEGTFSSLPSSFLGADALEPLAAEARNEGRDRALGGLRDAIASLDQQRTQASILESLLESSGRFASRAALFLTTGDGVRGWGASGFGDAGDRIHDVRFEYEDGSSWSQLRDGGGAIELSAAERAALSSSLESEIPSSAVLIPLVLRDRIAAAIYADTVGDAEMLTDALQILVHSAGLSIETLPFRSRSATPTLIAGAAAGAAAVAAAGAGLAVWEGKKEAEAAEAEVAEPEAAADPATDEAPEVVDEPAEADEASEVAASADDIAAPQMDDDDEDTVVRDAPEAEPAAEADPLVEAELVADTEEASAEEASLETSTFEADSLEPAVTEDLGNEATEALSTVDETVEEIVLEEPTVEPAPAFSSEVAEPTPLGTYGEPEVAEPAEIAVEPESQIDELFTPEPDEPEEELLASPSPAEDVRADGDETVLLSSSHFADVPLASEPTPPPAPTPGPTPTFTPEKVAPPTPSAFDAAPVASEPPPAAPEPSPELPPVMPPATPEPPPAVEPEPPISSLDDTSATQSRLQGSAQVAPPQDLAGPGAAFARKPEETEDDASFQEGRRLARLLVSEIRLYNEEQVEEGKRNRDILGRLRDDIERSRKMYEERVDPKVLESADYFQEELVRILAGGDAGALGD